MKLFLSQTASISSDDVQDRLCKQVEVFANYIRAPQRNIVSIVTVSKADMKTLKIAEVPMLVKSSGKDEEEPVSCSFPLTIMMEIAKGAYLDEILFGKPNSKERFEIQGFVEQAQRMEAEELVDHLNKHLQMRMFLIGQNISVADITVLLQVAPYFKELEHFQKIEKANCFRWIDHVQHLPGLAEQIESLNLFVSFPDETQSEPSKAQLKKMEKIKKAKEAKEAKKQGAQPKEEVKKAGGEDANAKPAQQKQEKKQKQQQQPKGGKAPAKKEEENIPDISKMDMRVGKIVECEKCPDSEKLYLEKIDIGGGEIREIGSGLQKNYTLEEMRGAMVVVICNLKPKKLAGVPSHGMVLCAQFEDKSVIEFLNPPEGSQPGDLITFEGYERKPVEQLPAKKNPWDNVAKCLVVDDNMVGCYKDPETGNSVPFKTDKGICKAKKVKNGVVG